MDARILLDPVVVAFTALGLCILALALMLIILLRQARLLARYKALLNGDTGKDLEAILMDHRAGLIAAREQLSSLDLRLTSSEQQAKSHVQRVGVLRFNAFPDAGSDLSFAIAVMDANNNGFVLSSLYGRNESRTYAKPIQAGSSTYVLTEEERQAISIAQGQASSPHPRR